MTTDEKYMQLCLNLAQKGMGHVAPNPMVGAVVVCDNRIIGQGYHQQFGQAHAEVNAINAVEDKSLLRRSTIYVNLEPCCHYGKTPPCAVKIVEMGIPHVVIGNVDPFPRVAGGGIKILKDAGVDVMVGVLADECWEMNKRFFTFHQKRRPYITLKWAQTADGYMDALRTSATESPLAISTPQTLPLMHQLRSTETAILVGTKTALMDNPSLTVRLCEGTNPTRLLIDRNLRVPRSAKIFNEEAKTIVFTEQKVPSSAHIKYITLDFASGNILPQLMEALYAENLLSVLVEGGSCLLKSFIAANLWDEARIEINNSLCIGNGVSAPVLPTDVPTATETYGNNVLKWYKK